MKRVTSSCMLIWTAVLFYAVNIQKVEALKSPVDYVNPYMGNISHLLVPTYPTVHLPNSIVRIYPERNDFTSDQVRGLPLVVTSHRGSSAFYLSPVAATTEPLTPVKSYSYDNEKITPYRYSVYLDEGHVHVDFAPSAQSAVYELTFDKESGNQLVVQTRNGKLESNGKGVSGYQVIDGDTKVYMYLEAEQTPVNTGALRNGKIEITSTSVEGENCAMVLGFYSKQVRLRYGISYISCEQAKLNLRREINTYSVNEIAQKGRDRWNEVLGKITVEGGDENDKVVFYTSLYRVYERMVNISEDGRYYSATDGKIHEDEGIPYFVDDWIWDTYRAAHPLRVLIDSEMEQAMITSYIRMAQHAPDGWMPTFPEIMGDTYRMNGNHAVAVVWDAYCKGLRGFDLQAAYKACKAAVMEKSLLPWTKTPATKLDAFYKEKGYFPALKPGEKESVKEVSGWEKRQPVAVTLGTCFDDYCLSQIAKELKNENDYHYFLKRSYNYRNLFNPETSFFHPKDADGRFIMPFDYRYSGGIGARDYYDENNGWLYRWDVQHNPADLIRLMGSPEKFVKNLDQTFREPLGKSKYDFFSQLPDHTGNVGQFSMANEPALHVPYLYIYAGQPWKTQKRIRQLLEQWFRNDLMGVPGDEDGGGMSAFVVFSSMGFYPVNPGSPNYVIGSPLFKKMKMKLSNGSVFEIEAKNCSANAKYIQSAILNGIVWNKAWFTHEDIIKGGKLVLVMGEKANENWASSMDNVPPSAELPIK
ncbi:MAG: GH92 family glycosyl hydrolase [Bacteroidales bacterium]|nr:GH92 family glycosyl hydrolase [Bacteroidales bacterium]